MTIFPEGPHGAGLPLLRVLCAPDALENRRFGGFFHLIADVFRGDIGPFFVVHADEGHVGEPHFRRRLRVDLIVDVDDDDLRLLGLLEDGDDFRGTRRGDDDGVHPVADQFVDDGDLLFYRRLLGPGLDNQFDIQFLFRLPGPLLHRHEEGVGQGLHYQGDPLFCRCGLFLPLVCRVFGTGAASDNQKNRQEGGARGGGESAHIFPPYPRHNVLIRINFSTMMIFYGERGGCVKDYRRGCQERIEIYGLSATDSSAFS